MTVLKYDSRSPNDPPRVTGALIPPANGDFVGPVAAPIVPVRTCRPRIRSASVLTCAATSAAIVICVFRSAGTADAAACTSPFRGICVVRGALIVTTQFAAPLQRICVTSTPLLATAPMTEVASAICVFSVAVGVAVPVTDDARRMAVVRFALTVAAQSATVGSS